MQPAALHRGKGAQKQITKPSAADPDFSLARTIQRLGEIHREVEFQWIRMFWLQGTRHAESHSGGAVQVLLRKHLVSTLEPIK
jgi:hypothetical protein